jgi:hypothetical protein
VSTKPAAAHPVVFAAGDATDRFVQVELVVSDGVFGLGKPNEVIGHGRKQPRRLTARLGECDERTAVVFSKHFIH